MAFAGRVSVFGGRNINEDTYKDAVDIGERLAAENYLVYCGGGEGVMEAVAKGVKTGYVIPTQYDSMIGKIIVHAKNRERAINRMQRALEETIIEGPKTTIPYHQKIMENADFISGKFNTGFLENFNYRPE